VSGASEVELNWEQLKRQEKGGEPESALAGLPRSLPAVARAQEVQRRLIRAGFDWPTRAAVLAKLDEELAELRAALQDPVGLEQELGDVIFMLTRLATDAGFEAEQAVHGAIRRIGARFEHLERAARASGRPLAAHSETELLGLWREAKALERREPG
jgi:tetrapyrrole methylase family protein/MazG family protein